MTTHRLLDNFTVVVPESQRESYLAVTSHVETHPDSIVGLTPKLNWMFEHCSDEDGIVFLDDDLEYMARCFTDPSESARRKVTDPREIESVIMATFQLAQDLGIYYFGWESSVSTIRYYSGLDPFKFTGFINGCAMGFRAGHGLRFDERIVAKNDYDIGLLNAYRHRICLKDTRYAFCQRETFTGAGGQSLHRNSETERRDVEILRQKFGDVVTVGKHGGTRKRDYAGVQKVTLSLPY